MTLYDDGCFHVKFGTKQSITSFLLSLIFLHIVYAKHSVDTHIDQQPCGWVCHHNGDVVISSSTIPSEFDSC